VTQQERHAGRVEDRRHSWRDSGPKARIKRRIVKLRYQTVGLVVMNALSHSPSLLLRTKD
jgi:hypothetical protein